MGLSIPNEPCVIFPVESVCSCSVVSRPQAMKTSFQRIISTFSHSPTLWLTFCHSVHTIALVLQVTDYSQGPAGLGEATQSSPDLDFSPNFSAAPNSLTRKPCFPHVFLSGIWARTLEPFFLGLVHLVTFPQFTHLLFNVSFWGVKSPHCFSIL